MKRFNASVCGTIYLKAKPPQGLLGCGQQFVFEQTPAPGGRYDRVVRCGELYENMGEGAHAIPLCGDCYAREWLGLLADGHVLVEALETHQVDYSALAAERAKKDNAEASAVERWQQAQREIERVQSREGWMRLELQKLNKAIKRRNRRAEGYRTRIDRLEVAVTQAHAHLRRGEDKRAEEILYCAIALLRLEEA
jgi:hypothetical protein